MFQFRGAVFFLIAVMGLLLFDHDDYKAHSSEGRSNVSQNVIGRILRNMQFLCFVVKINSSRDKKITCPGARDK